jgi:hypothetical protein
MAEIEFSTDKPLCIANSCQMNISKNIKSWQKVIAAPPAKSVLFCNYYQVGYKNSKKGTKFVRHPQ